MKFSAVIMKVCKLKVPDIKVKKDIKIILEFIHQVQVPQGNVLHILRKKVRA